MADRPRVIVALPDPNEATAVADWLVEDGFEPVRRPTPEAAAAEMRARPFDLLIADAATHGRCNLNGETRARRPLTPPVLISDPAGAPPGQIVVAQAMVLTRPIDRALLACYVSMAMLEGNPIRRSARKPVNRFEALVNGVPSHIVDISAEGARLEMAPGQRAVLPPCFTIRVPLLGVAVAARRMWARSSPGPTPTLWYGAALTRNRPSAEQGWRSFVDTVPTVSEPVRK